MLCLTLAPLTTQDGSDHYRGLQSIYRTRTKSWDVFACRRVFMRDEENVKFFHIGDFDVM